MAISELLTGTTHVFETVCVFELLYHV